MQNIDNEWDHFMSTDTYQSLDNNIVKNNILKPECSELYISTKTKITYLNSVVDLQKVFWNIPILHYYDNKEGVIKKQMKINCHKPEEVIVMNDNIKTQQDKYHVEVDIIQQVNNDTNKKVKFKDIRKISVGLSHKDLICYRSKRKGAFYNCFVLIVRVKFQDKFKEVHVKVFNTGKLEIPGVQNDDLLNKVLIFICDLLSKHLEKDIQIQENSTQTILINSNFSAQYNIDRAKLYSKLKFHYLLNVSYDPCSYPGIQCKFYYNNSKIVQNGVCDCEKSCYKKKKNQGGNDNRCTEISFMIFRTGSVLIVGNCDEDILGKVYLFIKNILEKEFDTVNSNIPFVKKIKPKKEKLKKITIYTTE
tara:strand:+ start:171 stop:1256 length:1086 start_codon:yes stop_codon:yes gene_type:complete